MFDPKTIEDHASIPQKRLPPITVGMMVSAGSMLDTLTKPKARRTARSVTCGPSNQPSRLKNKKYQALWSFDPKTGEIQREYDPGQEPLVRKRGN